jgi:hypothetical protein
VLAAFSEREFELCFNATYLRKHVAALAPVPFIPSQRLELIVGWDVRFTLKEGRTRRSVFLQHKRPSFAAQGRGRGTPILLALRRSVLPIPNSQC